MSKKLLTLKQWSEINKGEIDFREVKCPECDGEGIIVVECYHCGSEYKKDCEDCNGTGVIDEIAKTEFFKQRSKDLKNIEKWYKANGQKEPEIISFI